MFYDEDTITDQPERQIVAELIREKALHSLVDFRNHSAQYYAAKYGYVPPAFRFPGCRGRFHPSARQDGSTLSNERIYDLLHRGTISVLLSI